jgi:putative phage-type endonuclease
MLMCEELIDITDLIVPDEDVPYFSDEDSIELYQTCIHLMETFMKEYTEVIIDAEFDDILDENIQEIMHLLFEDDLFYNEDAQEEMDDIISYAKEDYFKYYNHPRSYADAIILTEKTSCETNALTIQINKLRNKHQPIQRTKEWYEFRHNLITASNAYKAFENQNVKNQLIYEKCQPLNQDLYEEDDNAIEECDIKTVYLKEPTMVNVNSTLHWGQKYEPVSVQIYEQIYNTTVEDFGCIQHETHTFLGASPDGINVDPKSDRYGRMLEIKNIVNREINGIPKKEYWVQMQLQMEVCELNECDFLETKFTEYVSYDDYINDVNINVNININNTTDITDNANINICLSKDNKMKGKILYFHTKEGKPHYEYKPLNLTTSQEINDWNDAMLDKYQHGTEFNYMYIKTIYWKLEQFSCVLVCRNKQWFKDNVKYLDDIWTIIEKERISGYEHRAPNKRKKELPNNTAQITNFFMPNTNTNTNINANANNSGCLLKFNKTTVSKMDL